MAFEFESRLPRRRFLAAAAAALALPRLRAQQEPAAYGLTAVLDGSGMVRIAAGEFRMGSASGEADESPVHRVRISQDFEIGKFEVSQAQWETVMLDPHAKAGAVRATPGGATVGSNPSHFKGASLPVESVSWDDIQVFLARLNARDRDHTYRLPTEAEWEYACKDDSVGLAERAWYKDNSGDSTQPVGGKQPNARGLYDTLGNVAEWVQDWYGLNYYAESPASDPHGPASGSYRVFRGGSWLDPAKYCRVTARNFEFPVSRLHNVGFRVVRILAADERR
ncbi:MAG TPA: formylglycine-generating enzyme family protein [Bryobacteraceae bacterium]|nr:formylglycine-generating enzyme family protein [Bryobacteraceae bacterium]